MNTIFKTDSAERRQKLQRIILHKCKNISKEDVDTLLDQLNLNRMYFVKCTDSPKKFLNIIASEFICNSDRQVISASFPLLGDFHPGSYIQTDQKTNYISGKLSENMFCAALKMIISSWEDRISVTYFLVVYEPII